MRALQQLQQRDQVPPLRGGELARGVGDLRLERAGVAGGRSPALFDVGAVACLFPQCAVDAAFFAAAHGASFVVTVAAAAVVLLPILLFPDAVHRTDARVQQPQHQADRDGRPDERHPQLPAEGQKRAEKLAAIVSLRPQKDGKSLEVVVER
jgi:hypothetical protein